MQEKYERLHGVGILMGKEWVERREAILGRENVGE